MHNPRMLRLIAKTFGYLGIGLALAALVCAGVSWAAELELTRQEAFKTADDTAEVGEK